MSIQIRVDQKNPRRLGNLIHQYAVKVINDADEAMREQAGKLRDDIIKGWPVDSTASRNAWQGPVKVADAHYRLTNQIPYAVTIEYGGYPGVGPKTSEVGARILPGGVEINGGIYPTQRPAAPVRQAISKRIIELTNVLNNQVLRQSGFSGFRGFAR